MALSAPSNLDAVVISTTRIDLTWVNNDNYNRIQIWMNIEGAGYNKIDQIPGYKQYYAKTGLNPNTSYCFKVKGEIYEPPAESDFSNEDCETTHAELEDPSDLVATAFANFIEVTFKDNSSLEDKFELWRKVNGGAYSKLADIPANMDYYKDTAISPGDVCTYKVRAMQGASPSGYSNEDSATALSAPSAPTISISEKTNKTMRIAWSAISGATGYKIYKSINGSDFTEIAVIGDVTDFLVRGLDPNTQYWLKIKSYNGVGDSAYSNTVNDTTDSEYNPTEFEKWVRGKNIKPLYLIEKQLKADLTGFTLVSGKTYTYELAITDRIMQITAVYEDGAAYTEKTSINDVESNASTFWFDSDNQIIYIHTSDGTAPSNFLIEGQFWLYITNGDEDGVIFNGNNYLPLLDSESFPEISQEIKPYFEGNFAISSGSIGYFNKEIEGEYFFDKRYKRYSWEGGKIIARMGKKGFTYSQFQKILTAKIEDVDCDDERFTISFTDPRGLADRSIVLPKYNTTDFPQMEEDYIDKIIPDFYGIRYLVTPTYIDLTNKKYKFQYSRCKEVDEVRKYTDETSYTVLTKFGTDKGDWAISTNYVIDDSVWNDGETYTCIKDHTSSASDEPGVGGSWQTYWKVTDYYVDYQRSIITIDKDYSLQDEDIIKVSFRGKVNSANELIDNGAVIFRHVMKNYFSLVNGDLDHDSIYEAMLDNEDALSVPLYKEDSFSTIIRNLEHSARAYTFQDNEGRLGFRPRQTTLPPDVRYIENHNFAEDSYSQSKKRKSLYWKIIVYYNENIDTQKWDSVEAVDNNVKWRHNVEEVLPIYAYISSSSVAQSLADEILNIINNDFPSFDVNTLLFGCLPGDLTVLSRDRVYNENGTADNLNFRLLKIVQSPSSQKTKITGEFV